MSGLKRARSSPDWMDDSVWRLGNPIRRPDAWVKPAGGQHPRIGCREETVERDDALD
jgi:hypothetical protein